MTHEELQEAMNRIFEEEVAKLVASYGKVMKKRNTEDNWTNRSNEAWDYQNESDSHRCDWR